MDIIVTRTMCEDEPDLVTKMVEEPASNCFDHGQDDHRDYECGEDYAEAWWEAYKYDGHCDLFKEEFQEEMAILWEDEAEDIATGDIDDWIDSKERFNGVDVHRGRDDQGFYYQVGFRKTYAGKSPYHVLEVLNALEDFLQKHRGGS